MNRYQPEQHEAERQFDELLRRAVSELDPVPDSLVTSVAAQIQTARRGQVVRLAAILSAAATLLLAVGVSLRSRPDVPTANPPIIAAKPSEATPTTTMPEPAVEAKVTLVDQSSAILIPHESENPSVTVVWVYPTIRPQQPTEQDDSSSAKSTLLEDIVPQED